LRRLELPWQAGGRRQAHIVLRACGGSLQESVSPGGAFQPAGTAGEANRADRTFRATDPRQRRCAVCSQLRRSMDW
jgi:hypothetical protein